MGKLGKKSLIEWGSPKSVLQNLQSSIFSKRNIMYFAAMAGSLIFAAVFASDQERVLVNINKPNELYKEQNGIVSNNYIVNIHNTQKQTYTYDVKVEDKNFHIDSFEALNLKPDGMRKRILVISTNKNLSLSDRRDTALKIKLVIFAKEDPKVAITKDISFMYPRNH
jgi:hypothetical protein